MVSEGDPKLISESKSGQPINSEPKRKGSPTFPWWTCGNRASFNRSDIDVMPYEYTKILTHKRARASCDVFLSPRALRIRERFFSFPLRFPPFFALFFSLIRSLPLLFKPRKTKTKKKSEKTRLPPRERRATRRGNRRPRTTCASFRFLSSFRFLLKRERERARLGTREESRIDELSSSPSSNAISFAAIINAEASRVVATMRQNSKYAILARQTMSAAYGSSSSAPGGLDVDESLVDDPWCRSS